MRRLLVIFGVVAILSLAAGPVAASDHARPFRGVAHGYGMVVPDTSCPAWGGLRSQFTAAGAATHLGEVTVDNSHCTPAGTVVTGGALTFVGANGDTVFATYTAVAPAVGPEPVVFDAVAAFTIVGGTGRFEGATGSGQMISTISWPGFSVNYWPTTEVWTGTISY